ncbi:MAG: helix-turn-helix domain-containing protein, partial [Hyphomicrobiales bacterium]
SQERLEAARHLVMTTPDSLGQIASACGFASQQALSRAFSGAFGRSPTAHRRQTAMTKDRHEA